MLTYGGTAQGAADAGRYTLTASGLTSGNYTIFYLGGTLAILPKSDFHHSHGFLWQPAADGHVHASLCHLQPRLGLARRIDGLRPCTSDKRDYHTAADGVLFRERVQ